MKQLFICPKCHGEFKLSFWGWLLIPKLFDIWRLVKCPHCKKIVFMKRVK